VSGAFLEALFHQQVTSPGIRWKLHNLAHLQKSNAKKFAEQADLLAAKLPVGTSLARPRGEG
jgi:hypothetical protein